MDACAYLESAFLASCQWYLSKHQIAVNKIFRLENAKCSTRCRCSCSESYVHKQNYEISAEIYFACNSQFVKNRLVRFKCYVPK